ncbi:MAG: Protein CapG [Nitrospira sp.]|nr:MAG: Protein CapG [Nitrospira sp.]
MIGRFIRRWKLNRYIRQGLQIASDCRLFAMPIFGSEPYLISIGKRVTIAAQVAFITHDGGTWVFRDQPKYREVIKYGRIAVHDNCFIGYGSTIMQGVSIGPNSVVAAHSVVTKDVPPNTVVGGVPARVLMTTEEYAEKSLKQTPDYDRQAYRRDKVAELLRLYPRP